MDDREFIVKLIELYIQQKEKRGDMKIYIKEKLSELKINGNVEQRLQELEAKVNNLQLKAGFTPASR